AIKIKGDDAEGYYNLAKTFEAMHIYADAVHNYDRASELLEDNQAVIEDRDLCMRKLEESIDLV
ncbi:MAG: hypothetical protein KAQ96_02085, partial [Thermoplasmata archaeon]|nr:hypothetical protein [Thermoplasmata archaeon]